MKILLIRYSSMGDVLLTTPVIRTLSQQANATVHLLTSLRYIKLFEFNPFIQKIYTKETFQIAHLKNEDYNLIVDLQHNLRTFLIRMKLRITYISYDKMRLKKWLFLKMRINLLNKSHVVSRYFDAVSRLGVKDDGLGLDLWNQSKFIMTDLNSKKRIVVAMGGTYETKRIPPDLLNLITERTDFFFYIIGGHDVSGDLIIPRENVINLIQKTSIIESASVMSQSDLVISGDTGMMHIAAALQKPIIVIWGSTSSDFGFFPYYGFLSKMKYKSIEKNDLSCRPCSKYGRHKCPKKHMNCLNSLNLAEINNELDQFLN